MRRTAWWVLFFSALAACRSDINAPAPETGLVVRYLLTNESGRRTSRFAFGDDIHFDYVVTNRTGADLEWTQPYSYPPVGFAVGSRNGGLGGSTLLGRGGPQEISGVLRNGRSLTYRTSWLSNPSSMMLPPRDYQALAVFTYKFTHYEAPEPKWLEFEVEARESHEEHVFSLVYVTWYFGIFCLGEGDLYSATILKSRRGKYELFPSVLVQEDGPRDECLPEVVTHRCLKQEHLPPIELTPKQATTLERLIAGFPTMPPEIDFACDPCVSLVYSMNDRLYEVSPCTLGPPEYLEHAGDLATFVGRVVLGESQATTAAALGSRRGDRRGPFHDHPSLAPSGSVRSLRP